jgi:hypothetical protein
MRCHICNAVLGPAEIRPNKQHQDFDPCRTCLDVVNNMYKPTPETIQDLVNSFIDLEEQELTDAISSPLYGLS